MAERSSTISGALLLTPTLCIVALRYGLPAINEVISNDIIIESSIHIFAIIIGIIMFLRYRVIEDHEYHRSAAIKRLRKSYTQEDKGLWDKSDVAIKKLEDQASEQVKGRKGALIEAKMSGTIGSLNAESLEKEVDSDQEIEVVTHHRNIGTIIDEEIIDQNKKELSKSFLSKRLEKSALKRLEKKKLKKEKRKMKETINKTKVKGYAKNDDNQWDVSSKNQSTPKVISCKECGTLNNSQNPYCTSCGTYLS
jgi:hypothetical protein